MAITLNDVEQFLVTGWFNTPALDISRLIQPGQTVTVILSDGPFQVPDVLPGGANTIGSKQRTFNSLALVKVRVLERELGE